MIYLLSGLLTGGVLTAICWPLFSKGETLESAVLEETEWDLLERRKDVVLGNIQDLDFEYKCRKLSDDDYHRLRNELAGELARIYEEIDQIEQTQDLDALIRTEVGRRRAKSTDSNRDSSPATIVCSGCRRPNPRTNKFCGDCGAPLS